MMASGIPNAQRTSRKWLYLILTPLAFLLKDIIATIAILSTEPGITARAVLYYGVALLPGTLFLNTGQATFFNIFVGVILGGFLYRRAARQLIQPDRP